MNCISTIPNALKAWLPADDDTGRRKRNYAQLLSCGGGTPEGLRWVPENPDEALAHPARIFETDRTSDHMQGLQTFLNMGSGDFGSHSLYCLGGRDTRCGAECSSKLPLAQVGDLGQALNRQGGI